MKHPGPGSTTHSDPKTMGRQYWHVLTSFETFLGLQPIAGMCAAELKARVVGAVSVHLFASTFVGWYRLSSVWIVSIGGAMGENQDPWQKPHAGK